MESPDKRRLGTFGSAGTINYPERKVYGEGHPLRPSTGTRHSSLGDHKSLEAEALAEVRNFEILLDMYGRLKFTFYSMYNFVLVL